MLFRFLLCRRGKQGEPVENASLSRMTFPMATVYGWAGCALHNSRGCHSYRDYSIDYTEMLQELYYEALDLP